MSLVVVTVLGFGTGLGIAWLTSGSDDGSDDAVVAAPQESTTTSTTYSAPKWPSEVPQTSLESTTTTVATTSTTATTTVQEPTTSTTLATTSTTTATPTTSTTLPEPWPVPTSVPARPEGTPADLRVAYPGQSSGPLRVRLGQDSQMVVSNFGGSQVRWRAVAAGGIAIGGQQSVEVVLAPGQSAALPLRTHQVGQASVTVTSPTQVLVVPIEIT